MDTDFRTCAARQDLRRADAPEEGTWSMKARMKAAAAFTMVELLVVIAIIGILASLMLPALMQAKKKPLQIQCLSNQRQIGMAMVMFMNDNQDTIPGPCYMGVSQKYYQTTRHFQKFGGGDEVGPTELIGYLATYLSLPPPPNSPQRATGAVAVCPAFLKAAPNPPPNPKQEGYSYFCNRMRLTPKPDSPDAMDWFEFPFGYMDGDFNVTKKPKRAQDIGKASETWAIMDADQITVTFGTWQPNLPIRRVHGRVWNRLYFDGHAGAVRKND